MVCDKLEVIAKGCGGYDYCCKLTNDITDPNTCSECEYFPKKSNQQLDGENKGSNL